MRRNRDIVLHYLAQKSTISERPNILIVPFLFLTLKCRDFGLKLLITRIGSNREVALFRLTSQFKTDCQSRLLFIFCAISRWQSQPVGTGTILKCTVVNRPKVGLRFKCHRLERFALVTDTVADHPRR
jgi:hypothetical protein